MTNCPDQPDPTEYETTNENLALSLFTKGMICGILFGLLTHIFL